MTRRPGLLFPWRPRPPVEPPHPPVPSLTLGLPSSCSTPNTRARSISQSTRRARLEQTTGSASDNCHLLKPNGVSDRDRRVLPLGTFREAVLFHLGDHREARTHPALGARQCWNCHASGVREEPITSDARA